MEQDNHTFCDVFEFWGIHFGLFSVGRYAGFAFKNVTYGCNYLGFARSLTLV